MAGDKRRWPASSPANRSAMADDVDGDPVFLASSAFMMRRATEANAGLRFVDIKQIGSGAA